MPQKMHLLATMWKHGHQVLPIVRPKQEYVVNAPHFRERAARAREMAQFGDDRRLSLMLLEVAQEMDAEAEAIEAGQPDEKRRSPRYNPSEVVRAFLQLAACGSAGRPVQIIDVSFGGAKLRCDVSHTPGNRAALEIPDRGLRLSGRIIRARGIEAAMMFDAESSADPALGRLLRSLTTRSITLNDRAGMNRRLDTIRADGHSGR
jgi:hypothetical protein